MNQTLLELFTILSSGMSLGVAVLAWRSRNIRGIRTLIALAFMLAVWALGYAAELNATTITEKLLWVKLEYLAILTVPPLSLLFTLSYTGSEAWLLQAVRHIPMLFVEPLIAYILLLTNGSHHLFYTHLGLDYTYGFPNLSVTYGIAYKINSYYSYLLYLQIFALLLKRHFKTAGIYRAQSGWLLISFLIPWLGNAFYQQRLPFLHGIDPTPLLFLASAPLSMWALRLFHYPLVPISYTDVISAMDDIIIAMDYEGRIATINPVAEVRLGITEQQVVGQLATEAENLPPVLKNYLSSLSQKREKISLTYSSVQRMYDLNLTPVLNKRQQVIGWLLSLHDITHLSRLESMLQRRNLELEKIDALVTSINMNLALDKVLQSCIDAIRDLYPAPYKMTIQLIEDDGFAYTVAGTECIDGSRQRIRFASGEGILGVALQEQRVLNIPSVLQDSRYVPGPTPPTYRSLLVVPMLAHGEVLGAFSINSPHIAAFDEHDELLLQRLADHAAIAVANARLYEQAQREISVRELAEEAARASAEQYHLLFDSTSNAICVTQQVELTHINSGRFIDVNLRTCELLGYTREELLQMNTSDITAEESLELLQEHRKTLHNHGEAHTRLLLRRKDGRKIPFEVHSRLVEMQGVSTIVSVVWDLTEHEEIEALQQQRIADLEEYNAELDAFAHTVSHDLKNPLSAIIGFSQMLEQRGETLSPDRLKYYARFISQGARKMQIIIEGLMALAQSKTLQDVTVVPLEDMGKIIQESWLRLSALERYTEATLIIADSYPVAIGYAPWIEEVWSNYLSNALKYGGSPPYIECGGEIQEDGMARFWVRDNGPGLSPEEQEQLFVPFARLRSHGIKGHGLGLSIVQRIVKRLGGTVGVESDGEHGCTFYFTLPTVDKGT